MQARCKNLADARFAHLMAGGFLLHEPIATVDLPYLLIFGDDAETEVAGLRPPDFMGKCLSGECWDETKLTPAV